MYNIKAKINEAKQFAKKHPTAVACATTAVVSWRLSHNATIKSVLNETTDLAYGWGQQAGACEVQLLTCWEFIDHKNLEKEFAAFAMNLSETA